MKKERRNLKKIKKLERSRDREQKRLEVERIALPTLPTEQERKKIVKLETLKLDSKLLEEYRSQIMIADSEADLHEALWRVDVAIRAEKEVYFRQRAAGESSSSSEKQNCLNRLGWLRMCRDFCLRKKTIVSERRRDLSNHYLVEY